MTKELAQEIQIQFAQMAARYVPGDPDGERYALVARCIDAVLECSNRIYGEKSYSRFFDQVIVGKNDE